MRSGLQYGILVVLGLCVVIALGSTFSGPLLYSLEKDTFPSLYHENTEALKAQEFNSTTDLLPMMQDLLDHTGPIVVNVRSGDVEQARRDLEVFAKNRRSFDNLVVKLDLNESEIQEFSKSQANKEKIMQELLNSSVSLDQLKSLEVQYHEEENPTMQTSIRLQGDTLRNKIRNLSEQYTEESKKTTSLGKQVGLKTTPEEQSAQEFVQYVNEIDQHEQQQIDIPIRRSAQISLMLYPDSGRYGDTIKCFGYYFSPNGYRVSSIPGKNVTIYLDSTALGTVMTDDTGSYTLQVPIENVPAGLHHIHAESGTAQSELRGVTVLPVDSVTTLTATPSRKTGEVLCTGTVIANQPVRNATVELIWDNATIRLAETNSNGVFTSVHNLTAGKHTVQARFIGDGYPINQSESEIKTIVISAPFFLFDFNLLPYAVILGIIAIFIGGAIYYLRRVPGWSLFFGNGNVSSENHTPPDTQNSHGTVTTPEETLPQNKPVTADSIFQQYTGLLMSAGLSEASHAVYCNLADRIARDLKISKNRVLTPREMSRSCRNRPYCGAFSHLVFAYERIRYGGYRSDTVREEFETTMQSTSNDLGGEDH